MVGRKQTAGCDIFEGGRCEITPRRFQVKSIIDKVSGLATRRATTWQPGFNGATRRGANTRQTHPEGKTNRKPGTQQGHKHHTQTHRHTDTQTHRHTAKQTHNHTDTQTHRHTDGKTNRKYGIQQEHNKHRRHFSQNVHTTTSLWHFRLKKHTKIENPQI